MPISEVTTSTGLSKTPIYGRIKTGDFPAPVTLSKQCVRWRSDEVSAWMDRQSENRDAGQAERVTKARTAAAKSIEKRRANLAELAGQA